MKMLSAALALAFSVSALAQDSANTHLFRFSDTLETVQVEDALGANSELAQYKGLIRAHYDHAQNAFSGTPDNNLPASRLESVSLGAAMMLSKKFLLSVTIPYHTQIYSGTSNNSALGDINVKAKWRITGDNAAVNVALIPYITVGSGNDDYLITDGFGGGLKVALDKAFFNNKLKLYTNLGYAYHSDAYVAIAGSTVASREQVVEAALGLFWAFTKPVGLNVEGIAQKTISKENEFTSPYVIRAGLRGSFGRLKVFAGASVDNTVYALSEQKISYYAGVKLGLGSAAPAVVAAAPAVVEEKKPTAVEEVKKNLSLERTVNFMSGSAKLSKNNPDLDSAAEIITKHQDVIPGTIAIEGYTDSVGPAKTNKALSEKRANAVKAYLVSKGVKADKLTAVGYGEEKLKVSPEKTKADREANRRVEFKVIDL